MGTILEAFLTDQLHVDSVTEKRSPEHQELCEKWYNLQEKLAKTLNSEEKKLLTELVDTLFQDGSFDAQKKFERGFRLEVLMTAEIFTEQSIFL